MAIGNVGAPGAPPYMSYEEANEQQELIAGQKRYEGVENGWRKADADNTNGKKSIVDAIRLS